jgi:coatomer protein complex subunit alpha (xenin)
MLYTRVTSKAESTFFGKWACVSVQVLRRVVILKVTTTEPLAYLTAKTNGLDDLASEILSTAGLTEADLEDMPSFGRSTLKPPSIVTSTANLQWPSASSGENFFDQALANGALDEVEGAASGDVALDKWENEEEEVEEEAEADEGGWGLDGDAPEAVVEEDDEVAAEAELGASATPGLPEPQHWSRNSPFAADHATAGSFETAMQVCDPIFALTHNLKYFAPS